MVIIILGKEGEGQSPFIRELDDSHLGHVLAMAPLSAYTMNGKLQPHSTVLVSNYNNYSEDTCFMCYD